MFNSIGVCMELGAERRVPITPHQVKRYIDQLEVRVFIEYGAGTHAGYYDEEYEVSGAIVCSARDVLENADLLLSLHHLYENLPLGPHHTVIGTYNFQFHRHRLQPFLERGTTVYSLDLLPRISRAQSMDVLSSMASLSGYKAMIKGAELASMAVPMFTTAGGTLRPAKVLVIGAGVAGLQAIATARRLGAVVEAFDVRRSSKEEVESLGARFVEVDGFTESAEAGGYAVEQGEKYQQRQAVLIRKKAAESAIVICTASIPGKVAPVLLTQEMVEGMAPGSVVIDLASEQGGNCELTVDRQVVEHRGVRIMGSSSLASEMAHSASQVLSNNYFDFIQHWHASGLDEDELLKECKVVQGGELLHAWDPVLKDVEK